MENAVLREALRLRSLGLSTFPLKHWPAELRKKPAIRSWKPYQTKIADEPDLYHWFVDHPTRGLALVLGEVSQCLISRDFDTMEAYEQWKAGFPDLAATLPTVETSRGRHVYARADFEEIRRRGKDTYFKFDDGELRLSGCYVAVPPTVHPSGHRYRWLIPLKELPPVVDVFSCGFIPCNREDVEHRVDRAIRVDREDRANRETKRTEIPMTFAASKVVPLQETDFDPEVWQQMLAAVEKTVPRKVSKRHEQAFQLCRALKAIPALSTIEDGMMLASVVRIWWEKMQRVSTTSWVETLGDFVEGWPKVCFPAGSEPMRMIFEQAKLQDLPDGAEMLCGEEGPCLLLKLCRELQRVAKEGSFFLSCRLAGQLFEVDYSTAFRWLRMFETLGFLEAVERGTNKRGGKATRYRYVRPL